VGLSEIILLGVLVAAAAAALYFALRRGKDGAGTEGEEGVTPAGPPESRRWLLAALLITLALALALVALLGGTAPPDQRLTVGQACWVVFTAGSAVWFWARWWRAMSEEKGNRSDGRGD
jgi:hypothetical protein